MGDCSRETFEIDETQIDQYGHVNYKSYPLLLERFQDKYMERVVGLNFQDIEEKYGLLSVVRKIDVDYSGELVKGDVAEVATKISKVGNTSFTFSQEVFKGDERVTGLEMTVVMCDAATHNKSKIPEDLRERLSN